MRWLWCLLFGGLLVSFTPGLKAQESSEGDLAMAVYKQVNEVRQSRQLPPLVYNEELAVLAKTHTQSMIASGKLSHDGFSDRFAAAREKIPGLKALGENVAMNFPKEDVVADTVKNWMNSPVHRANILRENTLTGVAVVRAADGKYYFTQIFGK